MSIEGDESEIELTETDGAMEGKGLLLETEGVGCFGLGERGSIEGDESKVELTETDGVMEGKGLLLDG